MSTQHFAKNGTPYNAQSGAYLVGCGLASAFPEPELGSGWSGFVG